MNIEDRIKLIKNPKKTISSPTVSKDIPKKDIPSNPLRKPIDANSPLIKRLREAEAKTKQIKQLSDEELIELEFQAEAEKIRANLKPNKTQETLVTAESKIKKEINNTNAGLDYIQVDKNPQTRNFYDLEEKSIDKPTIPKNIQRIQLPNQNQKINQIKNISPQESKTTLQNATLIENSLQTISPILQPQKTQESSEVIAPPKKSFEGENSENHSLEVINKLASQTTTDEIVGIYKNHDEIPNNHNIKPQEEPKALEAITQFSFYKHLLQNNNIIEESLDEEDEESLNKIHQSLILAQKKLEEKLKTIKSQNQATKINQTKINPFSDLTTSFTSTFSTFQGLDKTSQRLDKNPQGAMETHIAKDTAFANSKNQNNPILNPANTESNVDSVDFMDPVDSNVDFVNFVNFDNADSMESRSTHHLSSNIDFKSQSSNDFKPHANPSFKSSPHFKPNLTSHFSSTKNALENTNQMELQKGILQQKENLSEFENEDSIYLNNTSEGFQLPPITLLNAPQSQKIEIDDSEIDVKVHNLFNKLRVFKIEGDIVKTYSGPVVTTFEFRPAANVKVSRIQSLQDDLSMALKATSIRIQAPIPGKDVVGIEIPNNRIQTIYLREIFESSEFKHSKAQLAIALGKDVIGNPVIEDLATLPHLLIAGTTGSGKSVGLNAMILSMLYKNTPKDLRFIMIDPKFLEFGLYKDIPHLLTPIITDPKKAIIALSKTVEEMNRRYELMDKAKVKTIVGYNELAAQENLEKMPYIVIIIDEFADLMIMGGREAEQYLISLAGKARASGIHLIIATQRPTVNVVTGLIKGNLPSKISYRVGSKIDSKVILDETGAEALLGRGDMLFSKTNSIVRLHAPYNDEKEIERIVEFIKAQQEVEYDEFFSLEQKETFTPQMTINTEGDYIERAKEIIIQTQKTSISYLQRSLGVGFNKAASIVEQLEKEGFLSQPNSKGLREIIGN